MASPITEDRSARCCSSFAALMSLRGALLLNEGGGVEVCRSGIPTLHVGDGHLRSEAGLQERPATASRTSSGLPPRSGG